MHIKNTWKTTPPHDLYRSKRWMKGKEWFRQLKRCDQIVIKNILSNTSTIGMSMRILQTIICPLFDHSIWHIGQFNSTLQTSVHTKPLTRGFSRYNIFSWGQFKFKERCYNIPISVLCSISYTRSPLSFNIGFPFFDAHNFVLCLFRLKMSNF